MSLSTNASTSSVSNATTNTVSFRANDGLDGTQSAWANFFQVMLGDDAFVDALVECVSLFLEIDLLAAQRNQG